VQFVPYAVLVEATFAEAPEFNGVKFHRQYRR
jgi:hypothetical protein